MIKLMLFITRITAITVSWLLAIPIAIIRGIYVAIVTDWNMVTKHE